MSSDIGSGRPAGRLPRNYLTILSAVQTATLGEHLTAHDVFVRARASQPKIGFATVHRALTKLNELGHVHKVDVPGAASALYERTASPHAHFRCLGCGSIADIPFTVSDELLATLGAQHGVEITSEATTFIGRCASCAA